MELPYDFINILDKTITRWKKGIDRTTENKNGWGFLAFISLIILGTPLIAMSIVLFFTLHTLEYVMAWIIEKIDDNINEGGVREYFGITFAVIMFIPLIIFYGPGFIHNKRKERKEKKLERERQHQEVLDRAREHLRREWCDPYLPTRVIRKTADFKPKKYLVPHNFRKGKVIIPGVYTEGNMSTAMGYNNVAIGINSVGLYE